MSYTGFIKSALSPCAFGAMRPRHAAPLTLPISLRPVFSYFLFSDSFPCHTSENSPVSEHPIRMRVPSDHRESRDLTCALNPLSATLAENHLLSLANATLPKTAQNKPCVCHTSDTPRRCSPVPAIRPYFRPSTFNFRPFSFIPFLFKRLRTFLRDGYLLV